MSLDDILRRRSLRLKASLHENGRTPPSFLSTIYPAMDHGDNAPHVVKTPSSIPGFNDKSGEPDFPPEKAVKQVDEPGPSKTTSSSLPMVVDPEALAGYVGEDRSTRFIKRCVELITGVKKIESCDQDPTEGDDVDVEQKPHQSASTDPVKAKLSNLANKFQKPKTTYG